MKCQSCGADVCEHQIAVLHRISRELDEARATIQGQAEDIDHLKTALASLAADKRLSITLKPGDLEAALASLAAGKPLETITLKPGDLPVMMPEDEFDDN